MDTTTAPIQRLIDEYTPATVDATTWAQIAPTVRSWVTSAAPGHPHRARQLLAAGAQLATWCLANGIPLEVETALRDTTIERYCAVAETDGRHSLSTRATIRARLRFLARCHQMPGQAPPPPELRRGRVKPPYTAADLAGFFNLVSGQPEPTASRLEALLLAGLGAGCGSEELRHLRGSDLHAQADGMVLVELRGRCARVVPAVARYGERLLELAERCGDQLLVGGQEPGRRAVTSKIFERVRATSDAPPPEPGRLRSTWIADRLLAGVRLDVLMDAAGLTTPTTIVDLSASLPPLATDVARQQLWDDRTLWAPQPIQDQQVRPGGSRRDDFCGDCAPAQPADGRGA